MRLFPSMIMIMLQVLKENLAQLEGSRERYAVVLPGSCGDISGVENVVWDVL